MAAHPLKAASAGVLLFAIGLAVAAGTYQVNVQEQERLAGWQHANGTIVELLKRRSPEGDVTVPLIAFTTASGERVSFTGTSDARDSPSYVSAQVRVIYPPDHPQDAVVDARAHRWTRNALAAGAALALVTLGGYVAWYASRRDSMAPPR